MCQPICHTCVHILKADLFVLCGGPQEDYVYISYYEIHVVTPKMTHLCRSSKSSLDSSLSSLLASNVGIILAPTGKGHGGTSTASSIGDSLLYSGGQGAGVACLSLLLKSRSINLQ